LFPHKESDNFQQDGRRFPAMLRNEQKIEKGKVTLEGFSGDPLIQGCKLE
jgi:hypothetical protein